MASVFAVVSKKVFESEARVAGKVVGLGSVWPTKKYASTHASLKPLASGGHLFLVTVRPPNEALWLIAVLRDAKGEKDGWSASANTTPVIDITPLKSKIRFATGSGITAEKGKLGMSLQTPRTLTDDDVKLLLDAAGGNVPPAPEGKLYHLNAHETGPLPCLCQKCIGKAGDKVEVDGETFLRREAKAKGRVLYYWLPEGSAKAEKAVRYAVEQRMRSKLPDVIDHTAGRKRRKDDEDEDDE